MKIAEDELYGPNLTAVAMALKVNYSVDMKNSSTIYVVSGLPRSGTSMMMKMLDAGGLATFQDGIRQADADNPKGYYEHERVKRLHEDASWLPEARGKAIKIISSLLFSLPADLQYKIIFLERDINEVLASQKKMLERRQEPPSEITDEVMAAKFSMHLRKVKKHLAAAGNIDPFYLSYLEVINTPLAQAQQINTFLGLNLNVDKMAIVVDKNLYRQKKAETA